MLVQIFLSQTRKGEITAPVLTLTDYPGEIVFSFDRCTWMGPPSFTGPSSVLVVRHNTLFGRLSNGKTLVEMSPDATVSVEVADAPMADPGRKGKSVAIYIKDINRDALILWAILLEFTDAPPEKEEHKKRNL